MNRIIKFRAWNIQQKKFIEIAALDFYKLDAASVQVRGGQPHAYPITFPHDENILMQFTGLRDKNGNEIYEGDIISIPDDYESYGFMAGEKREVYFINGCFKLRPPKEQNNKGTGHTLEEDMDKCEVIGNIYENSNLLSE